MLIPLMNNNGDVIAHAIIDDQDQALVAGYSWCRNHSGYVVAGIKINGITKSRTLHRLILQPEILHGADSNYLRRQIDHINGDRLDNRRYNLRWATVSQNQANRGRTRANKSGVKGVYWCANRKKWQAQITVRGAHRKLGRFATIEAAAEAYSNAAREAFGEYAGGVA